MLNRDQILGAQDIAYETVSVPEWGGDVRIRSMVGTERDAYETSIFVTSANGERRLETRDMRAKLCALCIVGEDGKSLFTQDDVEALGRKNAAALDRVFTAAQRLSGIGPKDLEEARKPSPPAQS